MFCLKNKNKSINFNNDIFTTKFNAVLCLLCIFIYRVGKKDKPSGNIAILLGQISNYNAKHLKPKL